MAKHFWNAGDQVNAVDLNGNFPAGGTGADGALTQTSGTTTIAVGSAFFFVKNYSVISLTSTAILTMSGMPSAGTILALKSQSSITLTSSGNTISLAGLGSTGGNNTTAAVAPVSSLFWSIAAANGGNGTNGTSQQGPAAGGLAGTMDLATAINISKIIPLICGGGGGGGGYTTFPGTNAAGGGGGGGGTGIAIVGSITANTGTWVISGGAGAGSSSSSNNVCTAGNGGAAVYFECLGAWNFTGTINISGTNAFNTSGGTAGNGATGGSGTGGTAAFTTNATSSGGGGGSGGYGAQNGGAGSAQNGAGGASGTFYVGLNSVFA